ncbi:MAG: hypothetical protein AAF543_18720 [Pseudomonadota bacterium]
MVDFFEVLYDVFDLLIKNPPAELAYFAYAFAVFITLPSFIPSFIAVSGPFKFLVETARSLNFIMMVALTLLFFFNGVDGFRSLYIGLNWPSLLSIDLIDY